MIKKLIFHNTHTASYSLKKAVLMNSSQFSPSNAVSACFTKKPMLMQTLLATPHNYLLTSPCYFLARSHNNLLLALSAVNKRSFSSSSPLLMLSSNATRNMRDLNVGFCLGIGGLRTGILAAQFSTALQGRLRRPLVSDKNKDKVVISNNTELGLKN